ncbi:LuxR C-terminal-related transcriptional regulator [Actinoplanes aureus]|uniref:Helix-turn-helix transcriptional regulator n=1 Tax=Actinoplanes aureus TaxID=2792083 RepID=A0A931CF69_9ACTN|nr:LuxR C-terminal-related transcriptional regulator [Actinoplanes aureus]MBG0566407.1 helix-turn-helix transcriptional regulator [Actinoplanes aureus]
MTDQRVGPADLLSLAVAKTASPQGRRADVERQRLFDLLNAAADKAVTLVCAGAGWGKTMLVSAWARSRTGPIAWLSLDKKDNDPQLFWAYVVAALQLAGAVRPGNPFTEANSMPADGRERGRHLAAGLGRLPDRTILVIDDFHEIDDPQILQEMNDLLRRPPRPLRMVFISRVWPALALHRLRAEGQVAEIRAKELAFTADEAAALVRGHGLTLAASDVSRLLDRTEGWAAGLRLGAGFLAGHDGARSIEDFAGDVHGVDDYLIEGILADRDVRERRFLLQTSILDRLCADLANAVTTQHDGQRMLEQLERDNDFVVRLGPKPLWFRYHNLLREALGHHLSLEEPAVIPELHRRAARWYATNNSLVEALTHAVSARDWAYVGHVVATQAGGLILSPHRAALLKILQRVPPEEMDSTPELIFCTVVLLFHAGDYEAIPARIARARELLRRRGDAGTHRSVDIMLYTPEMLTERAVGAMPSVVAVSNRLLDLLATGTAGGVVATQQRAIAMNHRGLALMWTGQPEAASRDLWAAISAAHTSGVELTEINAAGHLALLQILSGSADEAAKLAASTLELADQRGWRYTLQAVPAHFANALVLLERHDLKAAQEAVRQGARAHHGNPEAAQRVVLLGIEARLAVARGELARARLFLDEARRDRSPRMHAPTLDRWLTLIDAEVNLAEGRPEPAALFDPGIEPDPTLDFPRQVVRARFAYATRDLRRAEDLLKAAPSVLSHTVATVEAGVVGALVADARGQATLAVDLLAGAMNLAAGEGIRRPFVVLAGSRLDDLIQRLRLLGGDASFIEDSLSEVRATSQLPAELATAAGLSDREAEVLRYLPTNLSAAEIATHLGVSVNTIKAHMRAIYRKLGAARRNEAVMVARKTGIL